MTSSKEVNFKTPPINEVVFGLVFNAPEFNPVHFGLYWNSIQSAYPKVSKQSPILSGSQLTNPLPDLPLPRVWFESEDRKKLIQLQSNRFHYNWRKLDDSHEYPRFTSLLPLFLKEYENFKNWGKTCSSPLEIAPVLFELTYINHYTEDLGWKSPADNSKILKLLSTDSFPDQLKGTGSAGNFGFDTENDLGTFSLSIQQGLKGEDEQPVLVANLTVKKKISDDDLSDWFSNAHDLIVETFVSITPEESLQRWGYSEKV